MIKSNVDVVVGSNHSITTVLLWPKTRLVFGCSKRVKSENHPSFPSKRRLKQCDGRFACQLIKVLAKLFWKETLTHLLPGYLCLSDSIIPWGIRTIVQDISLMVSHFQNVSFSWVSRAANAMVRLIVLQNGLWRVILWGLLGLVFALLAWRLLLLRRTLVLVVCCIFFVCWREKSFLILFSFSMLKVRP